MELSLRPYASRLQLRYRNSLLGRLFSYMGPALIVSVAYMDPGNYGTDIQGGSLFNYDLLWVVWLSSIMAMLLQYLSGKVGIATAYSLPELIRMKLKRRLFILPYWFAAEAAAAATDLAEFLGTVLALNLLFGIPMIYAAIFGAFDVLIILGLASRRFRIIDQLFMLFVSIISIGYIYEVIITKPDTSSIIFHSFMPILNSHSVLVAVGVIGATVMPHALFVHSWLTKNRVTIGAPVAEKRKLLTLHRTENVILLSIAGFVNAGIMIMAAAAFYQNGVPVTSIGEAYRTLVPLFGSVAAVVFLVTLLASGISSSTTGTLAGQAVMEGLLGKKVNIWLRRFITRFVNVIPTTIAIMLGFDPLHILVYSQVILSLMIPLPMIPLILLSRDRKIMGEFVNKRITTLLATIFAAIIIAFNSYLLLSL